MSPFSGWGGVAVALCFGCSVLSAPGQSYAMALYLDPIAAGIGASRVQIAALFGWATIAAALTLPFVASRADVWTARRYLSAILILVALAVGILSVARSLAAVGVAFFLLRLLCQGALGVGTMTTMVRWFRVSRGRVLAIVGSGYTVGEFVMPGIIALLQEKLGWRGSLIVLGLAYALVFMPLLWFFLREPPSAILSADPTSTKDPDPTFSLPGVARSPSFWILVGSMSVAPLALTGVLLHQPAIFRSLGWGAEAVPAALRAYAISSLVAAYVGGWLLERVSTRWGVVASLVALAAAMIVPVWAGNETGSIWLYASLLGVASGTNNTANGLVWPEYFGVSALGAIKGVVSAIRNAATALGAAAVAMLGEGSGGYALPLILAAAIAVAAACLVAIALPPAQARGRELAHGGGQMPSGVAA